jgi:hypothetical protein
MQLIMDNLGVQFKSNAERIEFMRDRRENHAKLQKEINIPFQIDRSVWEYKTLAERVHKANIKRQYYVGIK